MAVRFSSVKLSASGLKSGSYTVASNGYVRASCVETPFARLSAASNFTGSYTSLSAIPLLAMYTSATGGTPCSNVKVWSGMSATTSNGTVTFYPTTSNAATGTPLFSSMLFLHCSPWVNTSSATSVPWTAGKSISPDLTTVTFNVVQGSTVVLGGASSTLAGGNVTCMCMVMGY